MKHRYLRAYMAGVLLPTWFLLVILALVLFGRERAGLPESVDRALIFPMAVAPNLWGVWNVLYTALRPRRVSIGVFGALLPLILAPAGLALAAALDLGLYTIHHAAVVLPAASAIYYVAWKHGVAFVNRAAGLE
jgi:hypothetical protein